MGRVVRRAASFFHHMIWSNANMRAPAGQERSTRRWPVHGGGRNSTSFPIRGRPAAQAGSNLCDSVHPCIRTAATRPLILEMGSVSSGRPLPHGLSVPEYRSAAGISARHRHPPNGSEPASPRLHRASGAHEDEELVRASICTRRARDLSGPRGGADTELRRLRPQLGAWIRIRRTTRRVAAERRRILHLIGFMDNVAGGRNVPGIRGTSRVRATVQWPTCSSTSVRVCGTDELQEDVDEASS